ncbi:DNA-binding protein [Sphingopyxis sp.]|uniref:DNA-binding protein n=1 Tax=Sphingopyxis sp. TaxID=1908224 RepID=UPI002B48DA29|nr:DNA-binding protein [Sphingopyxis sp.]HJS13371.1 DNA-binding protein [Sphingopyxis sp.]
MAGFTAMADIRPFMNTHAAAAYLCIGWRKLRRLRVSGKGPSFRRHGRLIVYCVEDLDAWSRTMIVEGQRDA